MNYFEYKGIRSSDMGLRIESKEVFSAPKYEVDFIEIPGRDGELISGSGRFPNVQVVFLPQNPPMDGENTVLEQVFASQDAAYREIHQYEAISMLNKLGIDPKTVRGYETIMKSHLTTTAAIAAGEADLAIGTERISRQMESSPIEFAMVGQELPFEIICVHQS